ncbi:unnamed protein product [Mytilus edulis]|uniref:Uncharacterized protein n=1 Tax=Mytilus edulis TaxID=6550 RepID=A0A8S3PUE3_MYTED|nr:unnamed protein product [Mytilus edulis]
MTNEVQDNLLQKKDTLVRFEKLSPDDINCTSDISITESFTTTDQTLNGNHQENTPGITRSEILLCCALVCILFLTMISYARNRQYTTRKFNIIWQQNDNTPTDQRASETENIHLYSTVDDYSVQELPVVGDGRMQGGDNDYESNSSIPSRMDFDIEEDYIHPYNIPVYSFQDKKHDYEKLYHSEEYFASISHDGNDDEKSNTNTDIICASITPKGVQIGHVNIVKSSS